MFEGLDEFCGQDLEVIHGRAQCSFQGYYDNVESGPDTSDKLTLYEGQFDGASMARALEEEEDGFGPPSRYGGILVWTSTQGYASVSIALTDSQMVLGSTERVQQCVEAAQGRRESFHDNEDAKDVLSRLPKGDGFGLAVSPRVGEDEPGRLAVAESWRFATSNYAPTALTTLEKYGDIDSATARVARLEAEKAQQSDPSGFKISQDGVLVTCTRVVNRY